MECKSLAATERALQEIELIDTLWNVNVDIYIRLRQKSRINRYIMECKYL